MIDDLLDGWQAEYLPEAKGLRLVGHQWSPRSHAIKDFLAGNLIPYRWLDVARDPDTQSLLDAAGIGPSELPALFFEDGSALRNPEPRQVAERLGRSLSAALELYDLVIVGAGPAGLAAAVYGASEGLRTLLLDRHAPGGQAGSSSRIENYLGFPAGVSGSELTRRAVTQAQRLGAELLVPLEVTGVSIDAGYKHLTLSDGREIVTRTLLAATGMEYREHPAPGVAEHHGRGRVLRRGDDGGAGVQRPARARGRRRELGGTGGHAPGALREGRADRRAPRLVARHHVAVPHRADREDAEHPAQGTRPSSNASKGTATWSASRSQLERRRESGGGHRRGVRVHRHQAAKRLASRRRAARRQGVRDHRQGSARPTPAYARIWKERREPMALETSVPGVFAAGDIRAGAMNRVASAVGEGSMVVRFVHEYLALT